MKDYSLRELFEAKKKDLALSLVSHPKTLEKKIEEPYINRPGLALAGYTDRFAYSRLQVFGETEISYLQTLNDDEIYDRIKSIFQFDIPCIIVTKGLTVPSQIEYLANELNIAVISSRLSTDKLFQSLNRYLRLVFAPTTTLHGTLIDVFGVGIIITGKSGIGKSECALDLVERGHCLVVDDLVKILQIEDYLRGSGIEKDQGHFMEIRGVGLIDVERLFGIEAVRKQKTVDHQVELMPWKENMDYERVGITNNFTDILGINIPITYLPVSPGKNVSVIIEVIAMNHILKSYGYDASAARVKKLREDIKRKTNMANFMSFSME